eukprot:scaffold146441_cov61-Attheya_sp.AAC.3
MSLDAKKVAVAVLGLDDWIELFNKTELAVIVTIRTDHDTRNTCVADIRRYPVLLSTGSLQ